MRDIQIILSNKFVSDNTICGLTQPAGLLDSGFNCFSCPAGSYSDSAGGCYSCDAACDSCFGPDQSDCIQCAATAIYYEPYCLTCNDPCLTCLTTTNYCTNCISGKYLFLSNHTCMDDCNAPYSAQGDQCNPPCNNTSPYYYNDGLTTSCMTFCITPMRVIYVDSAYFRCDCPCPDNTDFYYYNGTCAQTCSFPFTPGIASNLCKICNPPCPTAVSPYFYNYSRTSTCISSCSAPMNTVWADYSYNRCDPPCKNYTDFYYPNGTCVQTCSSFPYVAGNTSDLYQTCTSPCPANQYFYNYSLFSTCVASCPSPMVIVFIDSNYYRCDPPCINYTGLYYYYPNNDTCAPTCPFPFISDYASAGLYTICKPPCSINQFFYNSSLTSSCLAACPHPMSSTEIDAVYYRCDPPCMNYTGYYFPNGTCAPTCPFPYTPASGANLYKNCTAPCPTNQYFYNSSFTSSCLTSCSSPMVWKYIDTSYFTCSPPCKNYTDNYYSNNSCAPTCPSPFTSGTASSLYSIPAHFRAQTAASTSPTSSISVSQTCAPPLKIDTTQSPYNFCRPPCPNGQDRLSCTATGSCSPSCLYPFVSSYLNSYKVCNFPCSSNTYLYDNGSCLSTCDPLFTNVNSSGYLTCTYPCFQLTISTLGWLVCIHMLSTFCKKVAIADKLYCKYPCGSSQYLSWDNSCVK